MSRTIPVVVGLLVAAVLAGCQPGTVRLSEANDGSGVSVRSGATLEVKLKGNPTTGYNWTVSELPPFLEPVGEPAYVSDSRAIGSGGTMTFTFDVVKPGEGTLAFAYARSWEETVPPLQTFAVSVKAR